MKKGLIINEDRWALIERLEPEEQSMLLFALAAYHRGHEVPEMDRIVEMVFSQICEDNARFDPEKSAELSAVRAKAGAVGGRISKRGNQVEDKHNKQNKQNEANESKISKIEQDKDKEKDIDISPDGDKEKAPTGPKRKAPPFEVLFHDAPELVQEIVLEAWEAWKEVRRRKRVPWTADAAVLNAKNLKKLSRGDPIRAVKILEQSTERGWQGLFELKDSGKGKGLDWDSVVV